MLKTDRMSNDWKYANETTISKSRKKENHVIASSGADLQICEILESIIWDQIMISYER